MRKTIEIGGQEVELEANLGTASFFQEFTGKNIFNISSQIASKMGESAQKAKENKNKDATAAEKKLELLGSGFSEAISEAVEVGKALAYIMHIQTKYGKTKEDISRIRAELTKDDLLAWEFNFVPNAFTFETYTKIMGFWQAQTETTSTEKN